MEVVTIEKRTFSYVCERFTEFAKRIESLCSTHNQKVENWLDSQEVCLLLGFSKRTLQYYRSSGRLAYSQIGSKIYYKSADIEKRTFSYVCERFTEFAKRIESLCSTHTQKVENWLDSQEVCLLLGVSKRTLQYYRSSGRLAYSQIGSKIYYKTSDIERIIADSETQNQSPKHPTSYEKN